jgi:uncharacterized protein (DUF433 family)
LHAGPVRIAHHGAIRARFLSTRLDEISIHDVIESMFDRIVVSPEICQGKPRIKGTRITVDFVLKLMGDGYTAEDIIVRHDPELEREEVRA